jgi:predicted enzyme related to lactoylglutathione lyase
VIADNGGAVVRGAEDTPYGRLAAATDPTGVIFNLSSLES